MEKNLSQFFTKEAAQKCGFISVDGILNPVVTGFEYDSRNIKQGNLFFALPGLHTNGALFINDAVKRGASVVVHEGDIAEKNKNVVYLKVKDARFSMSPISASFYDYPSKKMLVTGVTGTEGKSTTVYLIWQLLRLMGKKAGFFSTVQHSLGGEEMWNVEHQTTPEAPAVQRMLYEMAESGCEYAIVEASSHGLSPKLNRLGDVEFCSAVLTNITHEHLEFHGTWEQYREDKANLFRALDKYSPHPNSDFIGPFGVVNSDDKSSRFFMKATHHKTFTYSPEGRDGDVILDIIESDAWGNWYSVYIPALKEHINIRDKLPGAFNSANVMASLLILSGLLKLPLREIAPVVKNLKPVKGRMTTIVKGQPFEVVVDYAHTPSSFQTIFPPLRARLDKTGGKIISVFGSAGERDTQKRSEQGKIAAHYSDAIILTDEDPRGEKPMDILEEICSGVCEDQGFRILKKTVHPDVKIDQNRAVFIRNTNLFLLPHRPTAIRKALSLAREGDLVLLLGKGHENSIIYMDHTMPFDEITETITALGEIGYSR
ncbi:MAG: UDP-N-acetylmuramoyl-L-alanyl-D-glutamate--2,6-diaminopimelate ligase [Treponema sp.]|nr:UDP-N-acetylmuramoyl-L-alanyl-D-glutamate--2,6-diaminopimelate ligase [Treponema sp.]MCL2238269.1 UDP-N-acetylmuramoyl-L-alanyl-D-glutamate--2,6-diaminopimelate ligase [Treponema sp.]